MRKRKLGKYGKRKIRIDEILELGPAKIAIELPDKVDLSLLIAIGKNGFTVAKSMRKRKRYVVIDVPSAKYILATLLQRM